MKQSRAVGALKEGGQSMQTARFMHKDGVCPGVRQGKGHGFGDGGRDAWESAGEIVSKATTVYGAMENF